MGCNCKVAANLSFLQKKYGVDGPKSKQAQIKDKGLLILKAILLGIIVLPLVPLAFIIMMVTKKGNKVSIKNFIYRKS